MAESNAFVYVREALAKGTALNRREADHTIGHALERAGLEPGRVSPAQMKVVVGKLLPRELEARGVPRAEGVCSEVCSGLSGMPSELGIDSAELVFKRMGR